MSSPKPPPDLGQVLRTLAENARSRHPEPTLEEISSYVDGEMTPDEAATFRERLVVYPEAARRVAVLSDPESSVAAASEGYPPLDLDAIREAIHREDRPAASSEDATTPTLPFPEPPRSAVHPAWRVAALAFLTLSAILLLLQGAPGPDSPSTTGSSMTQTRLWEIPAAGDTHLRGDGETAVSATASAWHTLLLEGAEVPPPDVRLELQVLDAEGALVTALPLVPSPGGVYSLVVPAGFLAPGRYELRLYAEVSGGSRLLGTFPLSWQRS
ncbi:MAG: hypothetical protein MI919_33855 [Holophagales bacterium]|nr:hypothetical protein [Holophagales bacterium]